MKQYKVALLAIFCCLFLAACNDNGASSAKIGVVDVNRLMKDSTPGQEALKFIESKQAALQADLDKIQDRLEKNPTDEAAMKELQKVYATSQQQIQTEGQNIVGALFDAIQQVMDKFRASRGYVMLVRQEALDSFDPSLDVTGALMAEVNKLKIDFAAISQSDAKEKSEPDEGAAEPKATEENSPAPAQNATAPESTPAKAK